MFIYGMFTVLVFAQKSELAFPPKIEMSLYFIMKVVHYCKILSNF